jgi:hypothetical protein
VSYNVGLFDTISDCRKWNSNWLQTEIAFISEKVPYFLEQNNHVNHMATGKLYEWEKQYGREVALTLTEVVAWHWNLAHLHVFSYPGAQKEFLNKWRYYAKELIKKMSGRPR